MEAIRSSDHDRCSFRAVDNIEIVFGKTRVCCANEWTGCGENGRFRFLQGASTTLDLVEKTS